MNYNHGHLYLIYLYKEFNFKYYKEDKTLVKHLLTLKHCEKINEDDVIVEECKNEKELIKKLPNVSNIIIMN